MLDTIECKYTFKHVNMEFKKLRILQEFYILAQKIGELLGIPLLINLDILHSCELCVTNNTSYLGQPA